MVKKYFMKSIIKINEFRTIRWYNDAGEIHRDDGPAVEYENGDKLWYINGKRHRIDGPAAEFIKGNNYWYLNGNKIDCKNNEEFLRIVKLKYCL
jgi:hypothetical protein